MYIINELCIVRQLSLVVVVVVERNIIFDFCSVSKGTILLPLRHGLQ